MFSLKAQTSKQKKIIEILSLFFQDIRLEYGIPTENMGDHLAQRCLGSHNPQTSLTYVEWTPEKDCQNIEICFPIPDYLLTSLHMTSFVTDDRKMMKGN